MENARKELIGVLVGGLVITVELQRNAGASKLAAMITGSPEPVYAEELCKRYEQSIGFIMYEQKISPEEMLELSKESMRRVFDENIANDPEMTDKTPAEKEERWDWAMNLTLQHLQAIHEQVGEVYYGAGTKPAKTCRPEFTQYEAGYNSQNPQIPPDTMIEVEMDDGTIQSKASGEFCWAKHHGHPVIIGFRVLEVAH